MPGGFLRDLARAANDTYNHMTNEVDALLSRRYPPPGSWYNNPYNPQYSTQYRPPHGYYGQPQYHQRPSHPQYHQQQQTEESPPPPPYSSIDNQHHENNYNNFQHNQRNSYGFVPPPQQYQQQAQYTPNRLLSNLFSPISPPRPMSQTGNLFTFQPDTPGGCNPLIPLKTAYYTASVPGLAVCPQCYNRLIAQTCYASLFKSQQYPPGSQVSCNLGIQTIKIAWNQAVSRGMAASSPSSLPPSHEQQVWLNQFSQHVQETRARIESICAEIATINQNIQTSAVQAQMHNINSGLRLGSRAAHMSPTTTYIYRETGSLGTFGSSQSNTDTFTNRMQLSRLTEQLKSIFGPGFHVN